MKFLLTGPVLVLILCGGAQLGAEQQFQYAVRNKDVAAKIERALHAELSFEVKVGLYRDALRLINRGMDDNEIIADFIKGIRGLVQFRSADKPQQSLALYRLIKELTNSPTEALKDAAFKMTPWLAVLEKELQRDSAWAWRRSRSERRIGGGAGL